MDVHALKIGSNLSRYQHQTLEKPLNKFKLSKLYTFLYLFNLGIFINIIPFLCSILFESIRQFDRSATRSLRAIELTDLTSLIVDTSLLLPFASLTMINRGLYRSIFEMRFLLRINCYFFEKNYVSFFKMHLKRYKQTNLSAPIIIFITVIGSVLRGLLAFNA